MVRASSRIGIAAMGCVFASAGFLVGPARSSVPAAGLEHRAGDGADGRKAQAHGAKKKKKGKKGKKKNPLDPKNLPKAKPCRVGPGATCDGTIVSAEEIRGKDLTGASFRFVVFSKMDLTGTNFTRAKLFGSNFRDANLTNVNFSEAQMSFVNLQGALVEGTVFSGADLTLATLPDGSKGEGILCGPIGQTCAKDLPPAVE